MARIGKTIADLSALRGEWASRFATLSEGAANDPGRLAEVTGFGSNPGALRMLTFVPEGLAEGAPLVVVLHGCTQTAAGYDVGAGWSTLAERYGFALLLPEQQAGNNPKTCFNWFQPSDASREQGEALSIRQMIERMVRDHGIDRTRIFVTGLSAGGAMTSVMLACYPEVFAGGAILAGLPFGTASTVPEAFESMFQGKTRAAVEWGGLVRSASSHRGPWPRISVWHGSADTTVKPMNAGEIIKQWTDVHGVSPQAARRETVDGYPRRVWCDASGKEVIEEYTITGMAHGTPLAPGEDDIGAAGPFLLDVGISSSYHIAKFWGLTGTAARPQAAPRPHAAQPQAAPRPPERANPDNRPNFTLPGRELPPSTPKLRKLPGVEEVITKALKAAGLMK